jgi:hypothetical protein
MKLTVTPLTVLLAVLGIYNLTQIPVAALTSAHNQPPMPAIALFGLTGVATLASIPGLARGRRWAFWTALVSRVLAVGNALMGALFGAEVIFRVGGTCGVILGITAIVLLVRLRPGRAVGAASAVSGA